MLVDSHCHLNFSSFSDDLDGVVARAGEAGVGLMVSIGTRLDEIKEIAAIAANYEQVVYSVGVHPNEVGDHADLDADKLVQIVEQNDSKQRKKIVGLGETGLDFYRDAQQAALQEKLFRVHIEAARRTGLPVIIHARAADQDVARILTEEMERGAFTAVMHCFTAGRQLAETALALGLYISISGIVTFKNAQDLQAIVRDLPADRLLVETDAPYLAPVPHRGKRNEPAFVAKTADYIAVLKNIPAPELAQITSDNFFRLFSHARKPV